QDRCRPVDGGVAQPRLRRRDQARRHLGAARARVLAGDAGRRLVPRHGELRRRVLRPRDVEVRGQGEARRDLAGRDHLRDLELLDPLLVLRVDEGQRRVGRAEVDADDESAHSSTSAGATIVVSTPSFSAGSATLAARQPWWRRVPLNGPLPDTLPTSRIFAGSKPASTVTSSFSPASMTGTTPKCSTSTLRQPLWMSRTAAPMSASA